MECFCCKAEGHIEYLFGYRVKICDYHYNEWQLHKLETDIDGHFRWLEGIRENMFKGAMSGEAFVEYEKDFKNQRLMLFKFAMEWAWTKSKKK